MTAFLFIPSNGGLSRRVDLASIASLFSEGEEVPMTPPARRGFVLRAAAAMLLILVAFGDTVLVNRRAVLTASADHAVAASGRAAKL